MSGDLHLGDYDYVRLLTRSRVAWEYLRRNPDFGRDWRCSPPGRPIAIRLRNDVTLIRMRRRFLCAEAWGLYTFRRSARKCPQGRGLLAN
ncbi:transcriptional regulator domain-containing protein [Parvibaculum indicum]|uniref:transcriptional regulator domain-containing protein n=1 Tax=Parvibaculum indicum TaxID=562969 RepID=UPI003CCE069E